MSKLVVDLKWLKNKTTSEHNILGNVDDGNGKKLGSIHRSKRFRTVVRLVDFLFCESSAERFEGFLCKMVVKNLHCLNTTNGEEEMCFHMSEGLFSAHKDDETLINGQVLDIRIGLWYGMYQSWPIFEVIDFKILSKNDVRYFCEFVRSPIGKKFLDMSNS